MFKKDLLLCLALFSTLVAQASPKNEITMLVVPRNAKAVQIAQDIAQLDPVLLVSYQQTHNLLKLYAWDGELWIDISVEDYVTGAFFENPPKHTIIIESENTPATDVLIPDGVWCESGNRLTTTDPRTMIHLLGLYFDFPQRHWRKLARIHGLSVADINPSLVNIYWWQYPEKRPTLDPEADMAHWLYLDIIPPTPVEPVVIEEEPEVVPPAETPAEEVVEEPVSAEPILTAEDPEKVPEIVPTVIEIPTEKIEPVIETVEEVTSVTEEAPVGIDSVEDILEALKPAAEVTVDPFSTDDIPAAKAIIPSRK